MPVLATSDANVPGMNVIKLQTCIQINKYIKVKNKHFIFIIQNKNRKHIKIKNKNK
jgi:hypothetical protein